MATTRHRRKHSRKVQSLKDKERVLSSDTTFSEPLKEYNSFLDHLKSHGYARNEFTSIPLNLIDLAAAVIASMITGRELSLFNAHAPAPNTTTTQTESQAHTKASHDANTNTNANANADTNTTCNDNDKTNLNDTTNARDDEEADVFYFIQRILKRTQLSCTTLILALIYIDRFKGRLAQSLKKRTRLDQGADYHEDQYSFSFMQQQSRGKPGHDPDRADAPGESDGGGSPTCNNDNQGSPALSVPSSILSSRSSASNISRSSHDSSHRQRPSPKCNKPGLESWSCVALFLVAVICADKYLFDATFTNAEWAEFTRGRYTTEELNSLERRFLAQLQFKLYVSEPEFDGFLSYLEVILTLKRVWGRGFLAALSYSDVRILSQRLMPAYAGRLQFRTLQEDMAMIVWQVMASIARVYLTVVGTIMIAAASYAAMMELSVLGSRVAMEALSCSPGQPSNCLYGSYMPLLATKGMFSPPPSCEVPRSQFTHVSPSLKDDIKASHIRSTAATAALDDVEQARSLAPEEGNLSALEWMLSQSSIVQCVECL
ncbi:hypothetical protein BGZ94_003405 [Podila epigama]|nr:hypothetical protein BGZ94_003405 [Podila epigama]